MISPLSKKQAKLRQKNSHGVGTNQHGWHPLLMYQIERSRTAVLSGFLIYCVYIRNNSRLVYHLFSSCWHKHDFVFSLKRDGSLRPVFNGLHGFISSCHMFRLTAFMMKQFMRTEQMSTIRLIVHITLTTGWSRKAGGHILNWAPRLKQP